MYVEDVKDVKDRSNTPKGCNAMYVEDGKRTSRHIFIITFLIWYHLYIMLSMSKMLKIDQIYLRAVMLCVSEMSKMSKIDQIHLRTVMLCMPKMSKIDQIHLRAVMLCMLKMGKEHPDTFLS